jgi:hypothetical protein
VPVKKAAPTGITHFLFPPGEPSLKPPALFLGVNLLITNGLLLFFPCLSPFLAPSARGAVAGAVDEDLRNVNGKFKATRQELVRSLKLTLQLPEWTVRRYSILSLLEL